MASERPQDRSEAPHVFDQTNGVLGDTSWESSPDAETRTPPKSFGVPPITSL